MVGEMQFAHPFKSGALFFLVCFIILVLFLGVVAAGTTGKIAGRITDRKSGEGLPGVNVFIEGSAWGGVADPDGFYQIINVPPGTYRVVARMVGYSTAKVEGVQVSVDRTSKTNIALNAEVLKGEEVVIQATRPAIEMDRTQTAAIVNSSTVELMPVTSISEVLELQSGVVSQGGELHFRGGRGREVSYLIDGVPVTNAFSQSGGNNVAVENSMIQELEVISGTFNAEYGSAQSGIVNIVTKNPARRFSGNLRLYSGEWLSNRDDIYIGIKNYNPLAEKDAQFSLSGPLWSQKLGLFVTGRFNDHQSLEWYQRRFMPVDGWKIAAYQRWFQEHNLEELQNSLAIHIPDSLYTGDGKEGPLSSGFSSSITTKLSYFPTPKLSLIYQFFGSYSRSQGGGSSRRYQPDETGTSLGRAYSHFVTYRHAPWNNFFYNLTASYQYNSGDSYYRKDNKIALYPGDNGIQLISSSADGFSLGTTGGFYSNAGGKNYRKLYQLNGDINWQVDKYNFIKTGFIVKKHDINTYSWGYRSTPQWQNHQWPNRDELDGAAYGFNDYWSLLEDYWKNWETLYPGAQRYIAYPDSEYTLWQDYNIKPLEAAVYLQDKLELGEIIVNAGLRFDVFKPNEKYPVELRTEASNLGLPTNLKEAATKIQLSPRLGISFPISATGAFHAAYGHFFQMPSFQYMYNQPLYRMNRYQLDGRRLGNADLKPEKTVGYEIGLQQELTSTIVADVTAYYKDIRNLLGIEMLTTIDAVSYTRFINRDYGNTKGISVGINKKGGDLITGGMNYTFSYANGSSSDPNTIYLIQTATQIGGQSVQFVERKILPLDWDQRHTVNLYVNLAKTNNWSLGLVGFLYSGTPYSPTFVEKYDISEREYRNTAFKPSRWTLDFKAKKYLNLGGTKSTLFLKIDNLFDHLNQNSVYSSTGRADQNARLPKNEELLIATLQQEGLFSLHDIDVQPDWYSSPRVVQIGLEFDF
jgi:outer membrane receptor protein involved in Fe transport